MNPNLIVAIVSVLIALIVCIFTIISFGVGRSKDTKEETQKEAEIILKLDNISTNVNEIRLDQRTLANDLKNIDKEVYRLKGDVETAFHRIDELREQINGRG